MYVTEKGLSPVIRNYKVETEKHNKNGAIPKSRHRKKTINGKIND